jgi:hypothetical protein
MTQTNEVFDRILGDFETLHAKAAHEATVADRILAPLKQKTEHLEQMNEVCPGPEWHGRVAAILRAVLDDCIYAAHLEGYEVDKTRGLT